MQERIIGLGTVGKGLLMAFGAAGVALVFSGSQFRPLASEFKPNNTSRPNSMPCDEIKSPGLVETLARVGAIISPELPENRLASDSQMAKCRLN